MSRTGENGGIARLVDEHDLFDDKRTEDHGALEMGTVGWGDSGSHFDVGTDANGGVTLVKVRLFRGRDPEEPLTPGAAQGHRVVARIPNPVAWIPPAGTHVFVGRPAGFDAWVILQAYGPNPTSQFSNAAPSSSATNRAKLDYGADTDLFIKARSITLSDYENRFVTVGPDSGITIGDASGCGAQLKGGVWSFFIADSGDAKTLVELAVDRIRMINKVNGTVGVVMKDGKWMGCGEGFEANFSRGTLGKFTGVETALTNGLAYSVAGPANVISPSWIVSSA